MNDILMRDDCFPDWLQMDRADFISIDLGQDLPVGCAEGFPLGTGTLWAIAKTLGGSGTVQVQPQENLSAEYEVKTVFVWGIKVRKKGYAVCSSIKEERLKPGVVSIQFRAFFNGRGERMEV